MRRSKSENILNEESVSLGSLIKLEKKQMEKHHSRVYCVSYIFLYGAFIQAFGAGEILMLVSLFFLI